MPSMRKISLKILENRALNISCRFCTSLVARVTSRPTGFFVKNDIALPCRWLNMLHAKVVHDALARALHQENLHEIEYKAGKENSDKGKANTG